MALTHRGKVAIGATAAGVVALVGILAFTGNAPGPLQRIVDTVVDRPDPCPLTGRVRAGEDPPERPALTVKVENTSDAYPLAGLERADVIYEEPVEGGLTRFAAVFQCRDAGRVGPVRSARTTDPKILLPLGDEPLLAFSGAHPQVTAALESAGVVQLTETSANAAYERDDARSAPHNLFVSTKALYRVAEQTGADTSLPNALFTYDDAVPSPSLRLDGVPARTTLSRRYKALYAVLQDFIAFLGTYAEELDPRLTSADLYTDKSLFKAQGPVWHQADRQAGRIPAKLRHLDTDGSWSKSGYHGWVYGYGLHLVNNRVGFPKLLHVETCLVKIFMQPYDYSTLGAHRAALGIRLGHQLHLLNEALGMG